ncbi:recombinase family protein [Candidatus Avelusimicrobium caledoniensis]|uniref:recombinase family protein n=1 Tax=Candidatus Avelusimicrobium caledoniensis TaxID=3416220 RepID=UPI003D1522C9
MTVKRIKRSNNLPKGGKPMHNALLNRILNPVYVPPKHAIILARVSSAEQREGKSLAAQEASAREYCKRKQMIVEETFSLTESSTRGDRTEFHKMMEYVKNSPHPLAIVADTLDRFQRSFKESLEFEPLLQSGKFELHFISNSLIINQYSRSSERMMYDFGVMGAKSYVDQLRENTLRGFSQKVKDKEYPFRAPVGYRNVKINGKKTIEVDPKTSPLIKKLFVQYASGNYSMHAAAVDFHNSGVLSCHKTPFTVGSVCRILSNPFYYGQMRICGQLFPHSYPPIITPELFKQCERVRKRLNKDHFEYSAKPLVFRGIVRCKHCGAILSGYDKKRTIKGTGETHVYHYMRCSGKANQRGCKTDQVNQNVIEKQMIAALKQLAVEPKLLDEVLGQLNGASVDEQAALEATRQNLQRQLGKLDKKRSVLISREADGDLTSEYVSAELAKVKQEELDLNGQLATLQSDTKQTNWTVERLLKLAAKVDKLFVSSHAAQKNALLNCICANCVWDGKNLDIIMKNPFRLMLEGFNDIKKRPVRDSNS